MVGNIIRNLDGVSVSCIAWAKIIGFPGDFESMHVMRDWQMRGSIASGILG